MTLKQKFALGWLVWFGLVMLVMVAAIGTAHAAPPDFTGKVVGVHDGDTLTVLADGAEHKIRLAEIDAPETKQAFGTRAKQTLSDLCFGQQAIVSPVVTDKYGRTVGKVRCNGIDASIYQAENGMAWAYLKYLMPSSLIPAAESIARAEKRGLWIDPDPSPPWLFRHKPKEL